MIICAGKNKADSEKEVDRTIQYIQDTIHKLKELEDQQSSFTKGTFVLLLLLMMMMLMMMHNRDDDERL